jgi:FkbM family methyltransferase
MMKTGNRIAWLISHPVYRREPLRVWSRVARWEWVRKRGSPIILGLDDMRIKARPHDGIGRLLCYFGREADEMFDFMDKFLKPGMVVVDVGANIGTLTVYAARIVGSLGMVFACEADPNTVALLHENIALNGLNNVTVYQSCVCDQSGTMEFNVNVDSAKSSIVQTGISKLLVRADRLVDLVTPSNTVIDLLKIDVEGADHLVLLGAREIFAERPPTAVAIEVISNRQEIFQFLSSYGYELFAYESGKLIPLQPQRDILNVYALQRSAFETFGQAG